MQLYLSGDCEGPNDFKRFYESLGHPKHLVCKLLDITEPTLNRYLKDFGNPPKSMVRLLYLESHHGRRHANIDVFNDFQIYYQLSKSLQSEVERLTAKLMAVNSENDELRLNNNDGNTSHAANSSYYLTA